MLDLGTTADSNTESGPSGNIPRIQQQQHSLFVNSLFLSDSETCHNTGTVLHQLVAPPHYCKQSIIAYLHPKMQPAASSEESGAKKESVEDRDDRLVGHDGHGKKGDEEDQQVEMDDI